MRTESRVMTAGLFLLLYAVSVHFGVLSGHYLPALLILLSIFLLGVIAGNRASIYALLILLLVAGTLWLTGSLNPLFLLPPVLVNLLLAMVFGNTLLPGNTPLITQISRIMKGDLDQKALWYTFRVTQAWLLFFLLLALESLLLALYAPTYIWSLFTNFLNYLFLALFFLAEYRLRIQLFKEVEHPGFLGFLHSLIKLDPRCIKTL